MNYYFLIILSFQLPHINVDRKKIVFTCFGVLYERNGHLSVIPLILSTNTIISKQYWKWTILSARIKKICTKVSVPSL